MPSRFKIIQKLSYNYTPLKPIFPIFPINRKIKINLVTFGDKRMELSAKRFKEQAMAINFFDEIYISNEDNLLPQFIKKMRKYLIYGSRGFGYWCWKPQIILQVLETMQNNEILIYSDMGAHINNNQIAMQTLNEYIEKVKVSKTGVLISALGGHPEYIWTTGDLFEFFGVYENENFTKTLQRPSGFLVILKNEISLNIIKEWKNVYKSFYLVTDIPSIKSNFEGFKENRHDQSIISLISKKYNVDTISYNFQNENVPFQMKRDKDFNTKIKNNY
jgi:hypothetical protein